MAGDDAIRAALAEVIDPERGTSIVELGLVRGVDASSDGRVEVTVALPTPGAPIGSRYASDVRERVGALEGVHQVEVVFDVLSPDERRALEARASEAAASAGTLPGVANVICVGSGKGGVGKSTITANLTAALAAEGKRVAALDADVWGYSIPRMLGVHGKPEVSASRKILPLDSDAGVKVMSIEFFLESQDQAIVWRGPMLHKAIKQFLEDVDWGELDYLLLDLPPGTGDVSMTLAQLLPRSRFVIVTTPQPAAQKVASRASELARRYDLEILGVIENMSGFTTPNGERFTIFGEGGGQILADELDVPLLGKVPLQEELRLGADEGRPLVLDDPDAPASQAIRHAARGLIAASPASPPPRPVSTPQPPAPTPGRSTSLPLAGGAPPPAPARPGAPPPARKVTGRPLSLPTSR